MTVDEVFIAIASAAIFVLIVRALTAGHSGWDKIES